MKENAVDEVRVYEGIRRRKDVKIRVKFLCFATIMGLLMAAISITGYVLSNRSLTKSVISELENAIAAETVALDGWMQTKGKVSLVGADLMGALSEHPDVYHMYELTMLAVSDPDVPDAGYGDEDAFCIFFNGGDYTGQLDPRERPWYQQAKSASGLEFTAPYTVATTGETVVSAVAPSYNQNGEFQGVFFNDVSLTALKEQVSAIKYKGSGEGIIFDAEGEILADAGGAEALSLVQDMKGIGDLFDEITSKEYGFLKTTDGSGEKIVFTYRRVPTTGWYVGISVPENVVFASLHKQRLVYLILSIVGIALAIALSVFMSTRITRPIARLEKHVNSLAAGDLRMKSLKVTSNDEIGSLTNAFNIMSDNLRNLIQKMVRGAESLAESSQKLTENARQSEETANSVVESVGEVTNGMEEQLLNIDGAKVSVDAVFNDVQTMAESARTVTEASNRTADAARHGATLMREAIARMREIETAVVAAASVVSKLGENSSQIGEIVESISAIANQTNLLSLNAAIEAARAGEQGKGFAVVAEEVGKLAIESQCSASEIKNRIDEIQKATEDAVHSMSQGTSEVQKGAEAINKVGDEFDHILEMVNQIYSRMGDISNSVDTVFGGTNTVVSSVDVIHEISKKTSESTYQISEATEKQSTANHEIVTAAGMLAKMAEDMQSVVVKFQL